VHTALQRSADSFDRIREKQGSLLGPEAELPARVVAEVELVVVVQPSAAARHASSPYDAFRPAPVVLDTSDASLVVVATSGPTY
ncbi:hypothetical protein A2U01_0056689, partial [Trifolium medium]|nr:hypothetical protein [Trifolium medium]